MSGNFGTPALGFTLLVDPNQIITCVMYNSFNYAPQIALTKVETIHKCAAIWHHRATP